MCVDSGTAQLCLTTSILLYRSLSKWDAYCDAIRETFDRTHSPSAPWTIIRSDDKRRARVAAIRAVLSQIDYAHKDHALVAAPDPLISGGPEMWHA